MSSAAAEVGRGVYVVLPGDIDDPATPSGGNRYDREVCRGLGELGWSVRELPMSGNWPRPGMAERTELAGALAEIPDGGLVLIDGLVGCAVPDLLAAQAQRLRQVALVHLPLGAETGLATGEWAASTAAETTGTEAPAAETTATETAAGAGAEATTAARLAESEGQALRAVRAVVATSGWAAERLIELHGLAGGRVHVAAPGVRAAPVAAGTDGGGRLLCVASVTPRKGQDLLAEALGTMVELPWSCVCAGAVDRAPEYVDRVRRIIARHGMGDRMRLVGPRIGAQLAASYAEADLLVLASHAETYGMVLTEALARGIPVLATAVDGVPEALGLAPDGSLPGMLVPAGDPAALAGALRRWLGEPELRRRLRRSAADRRATLASWAVTASNLATVLEGVR